MTQRVALVALTTTGAAGDYVAALGTALAARATVGMWIPDRPSLHPDGVETHVVEKASTPRRGRRPRDDRVGSVRIARGRHPRLAAGRRARRLRRGLSDGGAGMPAARGNGRHRRRDMARPAASRPDLRPGAACSRGAHHACGLGRPRALQASSCPRGSRTSSWPSCPRSRVRGARALRRRNPCTPRGRSRGSGGSLPYKGIDQLCDALADHWRRGGERPLVVVGQGSVPPSLRRLERAWPSLGHRAQRVRIRRGAARRALASSAVCVMPYLSGTQSALPWLARMHGAHLIASDVGCIGSTARRLGARVVRRGVGGRAHRRAARTAVGMDRCGSCALADVRRARGTGSLEWYPTLSAG